MDELDRCYKCTAYGDDYFVNDEEELECACTTCPYNTISEDDWE